MVAKAKSDPLAERHLHRSSLDLEVALSEQRVILEEISQKLSAIVAMEPTLGRVANALEKIQNLERLAMKQQAQ